MFRRLVDPRGSARREDAPRRTGRKLPAAADRACPPMAIAVSLPEGPANLGAVGSPDSRQGAEFKQGLESASIDSGTDGEEDGRTFVSRGRQQHEARWHFDPQ